MCAPLKISARY